MRRSTGVMLADVDDTSELDASVLVAEVVDLLDEAECYIAAPEDERLESLHRRAALPHRLIDVLGDEPSRSLAQDADDRARRAHAVSPLEAPRSRNGSRNARKPHGPRRTPVTPRRLAACHPSLPTQSGPSRPAHAARRPRRRR